MTTVWISVIADHRRLAMLGAAIAVAANIGNMSASAQAPALWVAKDTHFGRLGGDGDDFRAMYERVTATQEMADELPPGATLVLPETFLGLLTAGGMPLLEDLRATVASKGGRLIVGAQVFSRPGSLDTDNVLFVVDASGVTQMRQRIPVPVGMWHPWAAGSTNAYPFAAGVHRVDGRQVAYLICYEQLLMLPVLTSFWHRPEVLIGAANDWWARDTSIPTIQAQVMSAWARLFDVPVIRATNL
ncbi:nitrilase-related carbon-nitrogen hydrolase [Pandoraea cepalis]|uniref:nitrilase-related carbon-nitrogen hydrolase n=1 Tax=Pandoraea cepalis TaxID=2508294 RepID=UPI00263B8262|nr:nitrilase-related carbon-nitrogen hydrolase [Pandoraea cepalis]